MYYLKFDLSDEEYTFYIVSLSCHSRFLSESRGTCWRSAQPQPWTPSSLLVRRTSSPRWWWMPSCLWMCCCLSRWLASRRSREEASRLVSWFEHLKLCHDEIWNNAYIKKEQAVNQNAVSSFSLCLGLSNFTLCSRVQDSHLVDGVAFKKTFSYAGFEMQPKNYENPKIALLNVELELKAEKENAEVRVKCVEVWSWPHHISM